MYKTMLSVWVPISLVERLDEMARDRNLSRSQFVTAVLNQIAFGKPLVTDSRAAHGDAAREVIRANPDKTVRELMEMLSGMGIKRGKTWVTDARLDIRGGGSKPSEE